MRSLWKDMLVFLVLGTALVLLALFSIRCRDLGAEPAVLQPPWIGVENFRYARSAWLDFISVEIYPDVKPDSIKVVNHSDRDTAYIAGDLDGGPPSSCYKRFVFPAGYVDRLPRELSLSVYMKSINPPIERPSP